jgi:hypothetical protein
MDLCIIGEGLTRQRPTPVLLPRWCPVPSRTDATSGFAVASIHLYCRLWLTLDRLAHDLHGTEGAIQMRVVTFRLELLVLLDACDGVRWRSLLRPEERQELRSTLGRVLEELKVETLDAEILGCAQNRLLDAVLDHARVAYLRAWADQGHRSARPGSPLHESARRSATA